MATQAFMRELWQPLLVAIYECNAMTQFVPKNLIQRSTLDEMPLLDAEKLQDKAVFWKCVRWLARVGCIPFPFHQEASSARFVMMKGTKMSTKACKQCENNMPANCTSRCDIGVKFGWRLRALKQFGKLSLQQLLMNKDLQHLLSENTKHAKALIRDTNQQSIALPLSQRPKALPFLTPLSFKGAVFAEVLLPRTYLGSCFSPKKPIKLPRVMDAICNNKTLEAHEKIEALLQIIYPKVHDVSLENATPTDANVPKVGLLPWYQDNMCDFNREPAVWIAPLQADSYNFQVGVVKGCVPLDPSKNVIAGPSFITGIHHVWGFSYSQVSRWYSMRSGDLILFGNSQSGYRYAGMVKQRFIWRQGEAYKIFRPTDSSSKETDLNLWCFGFTLRLIRCEETLCLSGQQLRKLCNNATFQSQTRLDPSKYNTNTIINTILRAEALQWDLVAQKRYAIKHTTLNSPVCNQLVATPLAVEDVELTETDEELTELNG